MDDFKRTLEERFGAWALNKRVLFNCDLSKYYSGMYLNALFLDSKIKEMKKIFKKEKVCFGKHLDGFYSAYNGMTLFCHSLVIYGVSNKVESGYCPLDIERMNHMLEMKFPQWNNELYSLGHYFNFEFCLKRNSDDETIFVIDKRDNLKVVRIFGNVDLLLEYCIDKIVNFYDSTGIKKGNKTLNRNWMNNMASEDIFNC